jgi:ribokinase
MAATGDQAMSVFVAGSLHLDVIVATPHLPREDETVTGTAVTYAFGGKGGNQAVAAARMGARCAMAGCVGEDAFAARLRAGLTEGGVDATRVCSVPGPSGMSVALLQPDGSYGAVIVSAANLLLDAASVSFPAEARLLLLQNEIPAAANRALAARARAAGLRVILNAAPARAPDAGLLALTDILVVNRVEAADLLGDPAPDLRAAAAALAGRGPRAVILTQGAGGLILHEGASEHIPAFTVTPVSTHGAGDAFIGALAARLAAGAALPAATRFAAAAAALHVATPPAARATITPAMVADLGGT